MTRIRRPATRHHLPRWLRRALRTLARGARRWAGPTRRGGWLVLPADIDAQLADEAAEADQRRCGWFDSSQDLREGLSVSEHAAADAVCAQLPVMAWVQLQLSGWRPALERAECAP